MFGVITAGKAGAAGLALGVLVGVFGAYKYFAVQKMEADLAAAKAQLVATQDALEAKEELNGKLTALRNESEAKRRSIARRYDDALVRLRERPDRLPEASRTACAGATWRELSRPDAEAAERFARDAAVIQSALDECQQREWRVYESLTGAGKR